MNPKLKACPACGREIAKGATTCVHCGKTMTSAARLGLIVILALLLVFLLGGGTYCSVIRAANRQLDGLERGMRSEEPRINLPTKADEARRAADEARRAAAARDSYLREMEE